MSNKTVLEELDTKISSILKKYIELQEENKALKETITSYKDTEVKLREEIVKLREEDELKELELEEINLRIERSIGLYFKEEAAFLAS
ncbi:MAG: Unknown protein [uncultured Sulfurovum sp.]|uniref:Uncharacterized protein n=1 Tax=uncultured Sulfurovum sp. TaxID=269237 RepID=A0A6S6SR89_9BACT|nr:MAG: Unknown protein [uncultured Sulfurovum sp.]